MKAVETKWRAWDTYYYSFNLKNYVADNLILPNVVMLFIIVITVGGERMEGVTCLLGMLWCEDS